MESFEIILEGYDGIISDGEKMRYVAEKMKSIKSFFDMSPKDLSDEGKETLEKLKTKGFV